MNANGQIDYEWASASTVVKVVLCVIVVLAFAGMAPSCFPPRGDGETRMTRVALGNLQALYDVLESRGESTTSVPELLAKSRRHAWSRSYLSAIPDQMTDGATVRDAWGNEIVFVPAYSKSPGTLERTHAYFVSGGPDGNVATMGDNRYSFEMLIK